MSCGETQQPPLPELWSGDLDAEGLGTYLADLERVEALTVVVKGGGARMAADPRATTLSEVRELTAAGAAIQLRYQWQSDEWWDTLMPGRGASAGAWRLVRMRQPERP